MLWFKVNQKEEANIERDLSMHNSYWTINFRNKIMISKILIEKAIMYKISIKFYLKVVIMILVLKHKSIHRINFNQKWKLTLFLINYKKKTI